MGILNLRHQIACETFCVGEDVSSEAASKSLMGQDRSWSTNKFRVSDDLEGAEIPDIQDGEKNAIKPE